MPQDWQNGLSYFLKISPELKIPLDLIVFISLSRSSGMLHSRNVGKADMQASILQRKVHRNSISFKFNHF